MKTSLSHRPPDLSSAAAGKSRTKNSRLGGTVTACVRVAKQQNLTPQLSIKPAQKAASLAPLAFCQNGSSPPKQREKSSLVPPSQPTAVLPSQTGGASAGASFPFPEADIGDDVTSNGSSESEQ